MSGLKIITLAASLNRQNSIDCFLTSSKIYLLLTYTYRAVIRLENTESFSCYGWLTPPPKKKDSGGFIIVLCTL